MSSNPIGSVTLSPSTAQQNAAAPISDLKELASALLLGNDQLSGSIYPTAYFQVSENSLGTREEIEDFIVNLFEEQDLRVEWEGFNQLIVRFSRSHVHGRLAARFGNRVDDSFRRAGLHRKILGCGSSSIIFRDKGVSRQPDGAWIPNHIEIAGGESPVVFEVTFGEPKVATFLFPGSPIKMMMILDIRIRSSEVTPVSFEATFSCFTHQAKGVEKVESAASNFHLDSNTSNPTYHALKIPQDPFYGIDYAAGPDVRYFEIPQNEVRDFCEDVRTQVNLHYSLK